jgi:peptidoglycan/xylan/chitin deacetylase (PgdA/CDA1 family)
MKLLVLVQDGQRESTYGRYAGEILRTEGLNWYQIEPFENQDAAQLSNFAAVILAPSILTGRQVEELVRYVENGGILICFRPCLRLGEALGLQPTYVAQMNGYVRLDVAHAICAGLCGDALQMHGIGDRWNIPEGSPLTAVARMSGTRDGAPDAPWLIAGSHGKGRVCMCASDLPAVVAAIRQGDVDRANTLSGGLDGIYRPSELFIGHLDRECAHLPQADVYTALLANAIDWLIAHPIPRLWYYPEPTQRSVLVMTSDDDWSTPKQFETMIEALEKRRGTCTFFLVPGSHLSKQQVDQWSERGHAFSCHPDFSAINSSAVQDHQAYRSFGLDEQILLFSDMVQGSLQEIQDTFGVDVRTIRQHAIRWQGYIEAARALEAARVELETNYYSIQPFAASYMTGSGRPMRFVDQDGEIINVFQQPTMISEDTTIGTHSFAPHWSTAFVLERVAGVMDENLSTYYTGLTVNIHPVSFADYAQELAEGIWDLAYERSIPIVSADEWLRFTRARYSVQMKDVEWARDKLRFALELPSSGPQELPLLTVACSTHGHYVENVTLNAIEQIPSEETQLWGRKFALLPLRHVDAGAQVEVSFGS